MSDRLPTRVCCSACGEVVPAERARRHVEGWARIGKGGTLSGVKDLKASDVYRCDDCIRVGRFSPDQPSQDVLL